MKVPLLIVSKLVLAETASAENDDPTPVFVTFRGLGSRASSPTPRTTSCQGLVSSRPPRGLAALQTRLPRLGYDPTRLRSMSAARAFSLALLMADVLTFLNSFRARPMHRLSSDGSSRGRHGKSAEDRAEGGTRVLYPHLRDDERGGVGRALSSTHAAVQGLVAAQRAHRLCARLRRPSFVVPRVHQGHARRHLNVLRLAHSIARSARHQAR